MASWRRFSKCRWFGACGPQPVARHRSCGATHVYSGEQTPFSLSSPGILARRPRCIYTMAHETLVYGFIAGQRRDAHDLHRYNLQTLAELPESDDFPYLSRSMFSCAGDQPLQGTFRTPVIHFGGSMNGLDFDGVPRWITKFESLLSRLYWHEASAHIWTDFIDGCYQYWWAWDQAQLVVASYRTQNPQPTSRWIRHMKHLKRNLDGPPSERAT